MGKKSLLVRDHLATFTSSVIKEEKYVFAVKKILQHRLQDNISHEKDLLELVCHKHIIRYYSSYYEGPVLCIVMEYADKYINKHFYLVDTRPSYNEIVNSKRGK